MVRTQELVQVLLVVDGRDTFSKAPRLTRLTLEGADAKAVAQEELFVE